MKIWKSLDKPWKQYVNENVEKPFYGFSLETQSFFYSLRITALLHTDYRAKHAILFAVYHEIPYTISTSDTCKETYCHKEFLPTQVTGEEEGEISEMLSFSLSAAEKERFHDFLYLFAFPYLKSEMRL